MKTKILIFVTLALLSFAGYLLANSSDPYLKVAQSRQLTSGELVRVNKLILDMKNVRKSIITTGPSKFQKASEVEKYKKRLGQFTTAITKYSKFSEAEVKTAKNEYISLRNALSAEFKRAQGQLGSVGDVQAQLREIEKLLFTDRAPKPLTAPFSEQQAKAWVTAAVAAKKTAQSNIPKIEKIASEASLDKSNRGTVQQGAPYDMQDINRLSRFANKTVKEVEQTQSTTLNNLKAQISGINSELDYFRKLDPNNETHRANAFLQESAPERIQTALDDKQKVVESVVHYFAQFGKKPNSQIQSLLNEIEQVKDNYSKNLEIAGGLQKLPKAKNESSELTSIAKKILATKKYQFGEHGPVVLTTEGIIEREKEESEEKFTDADISLSGKITLHGTKTTWHYKWREFKFATPIKGDKGNWYIWWITARNYSSGGGRTPIGKWVAGKSVKGSIIRRGKF